MTSTQSDWRPGLGASGRIRECFKATFPQGNGYVWKVRGRWSFFIVGQDWTRRGRANGLVHAKRLAELGFKTYKPRSPRND